MDKLCHTIQDRNNVWQYDYSNGKIQILIINTLSHRFNDSVHKYNNAE